HLYTLRIPTPPHPRPTPFPYTTLFRSKPLQPRWHRCFAETNLRRLCSCRTGKRRDELHVGKRSANSIWPGEAHQNRLAGDRLAQDRKSTRLNSSHLGISYAVFCLKKKK